MGTHRVSTMCSMTHLELKIEKNCGIAHIVDLACGAAEDQRCAKCLIEVKDDTGTEHNQRKKKSTSTHHRCKIRICVEFQRRLWAFAAKLGNSVSDHAEEFLIFLVKHAREVFGVKGRKSRQPWISWCTWCTVKVIAPLRRLANQAGKSGRFAWMKCYFAAWMATRPCPGDHQQGPHKGWKAYGTHQEWARRAARSFYLASAFWAQADRLKCMVKPALVADKLAFLEWNAKEAQRLASNGDSHGMHCIVRALAVRAQNGVALPTYKKDGTLTSGDDERELRLQEHFAWGLREMRARP